MITVRKAAERGHTRLDWLDSRHTFSFGNYYDPAQNGFSVLRVINDDWIAPGRGFDMHPHSDMEILTYVTQGKVEHRDSTGNHGLVPAGEVQMMSAGTGIVHSETNPSPSEPLRLLQIWILPREHGLRPGYEQRMLERGNGEGFSLVASPDGRNGSLKIHQDVAIYSGLLKKGSDETREVASGRRGYVHVVRGRVGLNGVEMVNGDGAKIADEERLAFGAVDEADVLLFDLP
jgi:quercetin 2,3-dioxygenase